MENSTDLELSSESLNSIRTVLGTMRDVPPEFITDLEVWARGWPHRNKGKPIAAKLPSWRHVRPYSVCELAKLPGMPGETTIYKILKELTPEKRAKARNLSGDLTPDTVDMIFRRVAEPKVKEVGGVR